MYKNDRTRKEILVDFGFRLPSALDNRPLTFEEFEATVNQAVYMSATPGPYELERSGGQIAQQLIRPTGIVDPSITVKPTDGQIDDLLEEVRRRVERGERALVTTLTKKMAEDLTDYLKELGVKVQYLHSEVDTLERVAILRDLRLGVFDVLVGINLLREGIDLPEVTLVAILDADKEGFLRSAWSLIQMIGRAARNIGGEVIMYADRVTESMQVAIDETDRRRVDPGGLQRRQGHRADDHRQGHPRPQPAAAGRRRVDHRLHLGAGRGDDRDPLVGGGRPQEGRGTGRADGGGDAVRGPGARVRAGRGVARRDPADPTARPGAGRLGHGRPGSGASGCRCRREGRGGLTGAADRARGRRAEEAAIAAGPVMEVTNVTVLPAEDEPAASAQPGGDPHGHDDEGDGEGTASDWLPGIRDEHDDGGGWQAGWLDRPTWDRTVTPNIRKRTGQRPARRR